MSNRVNLFKYYQGDYWTKIDDWIPTNPNDCIFRNVKNAILLPVSQFYGLEPNIAFD